MSKNIEKYLETIYSITRENELASTVAISRRLKVAPASVTEMLKKLDEKDFIKYSPYQGAILTKTGLKFGEQMTRRHRLLECFLYDILKMDKDRIHAQACEMEHTLNDETERALCLTLKHPARCSDDQKPIPACDLQFASCLDCQNWSGDDIRKVAKRESNLMEVSTLKEQEIASVAFIRGDSRLLRRLSEMGITPGARVTITRLSSPKAPLEITVDDAEITLGRDIALNVFVKRTEEGEKVKQFQETLSTTNKRLEERNRQNTIMSEMRGLLQSCSTIKEIPPIITVSITKLFPGVSGALFMMNEPRTELQSVARWGDFPEEVDENIFGPDACWGLRRGRIHEVEDVQVGPICPHIKHRPYTPYFCLPLIAKGEILGLLHLRMNSSQAGEDQWRNITDLKETVVIFAEYLALSIANIKLWERLTDQSIRDPLTGLFNRRYMEETMRREILRSAVNQTQIGIIMIDIDHFKQFNDRHGHKAGDELLIKLADFLKFEIRGSDIAFRYGGEEFLLILPSATSEGTFKRAEHIREEVKNMQVRFNDQLLPNITVSMGIAMYPDRGTELNDLIQVADSALYQAKEQGRDRVICG